MNCHDREEKLLDEGESSGQTLSPLFHLSDKAGRIVVNRMRKRSSAIMNTKSLIGDLIII